MAADRPRAAPQAGGYGGVAQLLRWAALAVAVAVGAVLLPGTLRDAGAFALVLLGLPVLLSALPPLLAGRSAVAAVTWLAAVASTAWALLLGLGVGLFLLPAAVLLLLAALLQDQDRRGGPEN